MSAVFNIVRPSPQAPVLHTVANTAKPFALVCMPWGSIKKPSLAIPLLKRHAQMAGFSPEVHLLNIRFAEMLGLDLYEEFAERTLHPEWFFAQHLVGQGGLGWLNNSWEDLDETSSGRDFKKQLIKIVGDDEGKCLRIATDFVPRFIDLCVSNIDWSKYMVVGFTTTFAQTLASALLAREIKLRHPEVRIVFGGANVDGEMGVELMNAFGWIDYVAHGEAEHSFPELLGRIAGSDFKAKITSVSYRDGEQIVRADHDHPPFVDLNSSPTPDYSDYVRELKRSGFSNKMALSLFFESSRGCWWGAKHHCTFCGLNGNGMTFRQKDPKKVVAEILELSHEYRCLNFSAADNILPREYFSEMLPALTEADTDIQLFYEVKANLSKDQVRTLSRSGVRSIQPGIESFNSRLLTLMRKGVRAIQNIQLIKWCLEWGINPAYNILFGFPGETSEDYTDLPQIFRTISHLRPPGDLNPVLFERFSPYHFERERFELTLRPLSGYEFLFPPDRVSLEKIAYFFEGEWANQKAEPRSYMKPTLEEWERWKESWERQDTYCYYHRGPQYLVIFDNRKLHPGSIGKGRRTHLTEPLASIYLFCDENRSFQAIAQETRRLFGSNWTDEKVLALLEQTVAQGYMFKEENRYLSLATRKRSLGLPPQTPAK